MGGLELARGVKSITKQIANDSDQRVAIDNKFASAIEVAEPRTVSELLWDKGRGPRH